MNSPQLRFAITAWIAAASLLCANAASSASDKQPQGDAERGRVVFEKRCTGCHALDHDREGPHLRGVYGRNAGTAAGFNYSDAVRNSHIVWNDLTLNEWLTDPDAMLPGNDMGFRVVNSQERADLIRFLQIQSAN